MVTPLLSCSFCFSCLSFRCFRFTLSLPLLELPLSFFTLVKCDDVGKDALGDVLNLMLRNAGIVDELLSTSQVKKFPSGSILNFQGTSVDVRMTVGRWQTSFSDFDYPNHRGLMSVPTGDQIYKQNADTRQECLHRNYSVALLLYHRSKMLSIELDA